MGSRACPQLGPWENAAWRPPPQLVAESPEAFSASLPLKTQEITFCKCPRCLLFRRRLRPIGVGREGGGEEAEKSECSPREQLMLEAHLGGQPRESGATGGGGGVLGGSVGVLKRPLRCTVRS